MKFFEHKRFLIVVIFLLYCDDASARRNARRNRPMERKRKAKCSKPDPVEHAELGEKYEKKNKFKDGDKIKYNCEKGYMEDGTSTERMCKKGKWSEVQFSCEVSKCNMITNFIGGSVDYFGERSLYSQAFYSCYENYTLIPPNVDFSTCEKNQQWRPPPPACHRKAEILIPENGYLIGKKRSGVLHGEKYQICCNNGFEVESAGIFTHEIKTCQTIRNNNGTLEPKVQCLEERCSFNASEACFLEDDNRKCRRGDFKIQSGSSVNIRCDTRHQLFVSGKMVKGQGSLNCKHGSYPGFKCMPNLTASSTQRNVTDAQNDFMVQNKDNSKEENDYIDTDSENYDAEEAYDIFSSEQVEGCTLSDDQRYTYVDMKNTEIKPGEKIAVGMKLKVQCKFIDIYSFLTYDYENYTYYEDSVEPIVTCNDDNEMSQHYLTCPEGNEGDECMKVDNGEVRKSNFGYYIVSCNDGFSLETIVPEGERCTCNNGHLTNIIGGQPKCLPDLTANITQRNVTDAQNDSMDQDKDKSKEENYYINADSENFEAEVANDSLSSEQVEGCTLSDDQRYKYVNMHDIEIKPGEKIAVGMTLKVQCKFIDMYSFLTYDYENYTNYEDSVEPTITCNNDNEMSKHSLTCTEENKNDECMKVDNGEVRKSNWYYIVSCNDGFSLETIVREGERCTCNNGILTSIIGGQPNCLPDPCLVPYDFDSRISISDRYFVSLSGGSVVQVGEIVFFNCSKSSDGLYEPFNRRFKCKNGLWIEDERDKAWKLGNNGTFPECRKAKCEPKCQNGGFCYKDNFCRCKHLTEGKHCEQVICDNECKANGGKCIGPGKCECPLDRFGSNCEIIGCKLPDLENMKNLQFSKDVFAPGETIHTFQCEPGYFLSANHGMTCQKDGLWSDEVDCVKGIVYLISTNTGSRRYAGTNAKVDLTLLGAGGSTRRIDFDGSFERNNVDVMRTMAKDIRPIKSVHIEHDGSGVGPGWYLDYVSIYVENVEEFYIFRNRERLWVME